jgi:hypothetical protein
MVGYPAMIKEKLKDTFEYVNYAISGDTTTQCLERHLLEVVDVKPDILVLLMSKTVFTQLKLVKNISLAK